MDVPKPPFGMIKALVMWFADFIAMPGRVKEIAALKAEERDPRPVCPACGVGRVSLKGWATNQNGRHLPRGTCGECNVRWSMEADGSAVRGLAYD